MTNPLLERRVTYVRGSVLKEQDLERVAADEALAFFVLSDWWVSWC
jgi:hypothetical protein